MSLDYRIHWIDDDKNYPQSLEDSLKIEFKNRINFDFDFALDGSRVDELVDSEHLDLIILDFNLEHDQRGDSIIERLRDAGELTEIIFYSADPEVYGKCGGIEGVHVCIRDDVEDKIIETVEWFINRNNNVSVMRGVIISEAIDVENKVSEIILALFGDKSDMFKRRILQERYFDFGSKIKFINGAIKDLIAAEKKKVETNRIFVEKINCMKSILADLDDEVVQPRNTLAHAQKSVVNGVLTLESSNKSEPIKFDDTWKNKIRQDMKKHLQNLSKLKKELLREA